MHVLINYLVNIPPSTWYHFGEFLAGAAGLSVLIKLITHIFGLKGKDWLLRTLNGGFALIAVAAQAYASGGALLGPVFKQSAALAVASATVYHIAVSPLYKKFVAAEQKIEAYDEEHPETLVETPLEAPTDPQAILPQAAPEE